ncbi:MAG TPA: hypothetical protein PLD88_06565, partial [Candidatus Berkiella sp.]|nr:hypothetical protein [Candidatus Berkiella sp.]
MVLEDLSIDTPRFTLTAKQLETHWDWFDLLRNKTISEIIAQKATITLTVTASKKIETQAVPLDTQAIESALTEVKTELHKLPVPFKVGHLVLEDSSLIWGTEHHHIDKLVLLNTDTGHENLFQEIHYQGSAGTFDATIAN